MKPLNILVVEDERITARDIKYSLEKLGYCVPAVVSRGEDAIEGSADYHPDLVLMDIVLKGEIDGIEAADIIRDRYHIPVIFLTAYSDDDTLKRAGITEPFGYILKPFDDRELHSSIQIAIARHQAELKILKNLELAEELRKEAEKLTELKSRYLSIASHEFRTPMTTIQGSTELLQYYSHKMSDKKKLVHYQRIKDAVKNMTTLLDEVITIGQAESGKLTFNPDPMDLVSFCRQLVEEQEVSITTKHKLEFQVCGDIPSQGHFDKKLLRHILTNLLSNAIKYSPAGGTVDFTLTGTPSQVVFQIQDCGIGIPGAELGQLFESFQRASNVGTIPGTGLGLAIVKICVDAHGGTIAVDSKMGAGTTFTVVLPYYNASPLNA